MTGMHLLGIVLATSKSGPSSAFEKSGPAKNHQIRFARAEGTSLGESTIPPLVRGVRGISPEKILYFRTSVETILRMFAANEKVFKLFF